MGRKFVITPDMWEKLMGYADFQLREAKLK